MINFDEFDIEERYGFNPDQYLNYVSDNDFINIKYIIRVKYKDRHEFAKLLDDNGYIWNSGISIPDNMAIFNLYGKPGDVYLIGLIKQPGKGKRIINAPHGEIIIDYNPID